MKKTISLALLTLAITTLCAFAQEQPADFGPLKPIPDSAKPVKQDLHLVGPTTPPPDAAMNAAAERGDKDTFWDSMKQYTAEAAQGRVEEQAALAIGYALGDDCYQDLHNAVLDSKIPDAIHIMTRTEAITKAMGTNSNLIESAAWLKVAINKANSLPTDPTDEAQGQAGNQLLAQLFDIEKQALASRPQDPNQTNSIDAQITIRAKQLEKAGNDYKENQKTALQKAQTPQPIISDTQADH